MKYISKNKTSREIAEDMYTSIRTVQNHRANICLKLGIRGANKLLQYSMENRNLL
jgi:NarL family two-component system response regulator LiaR